MRGGKPAERTAAIARYTDFALIRHGETEWNREGRIQGQLDTALNTRGREQARSVARALGSEPWSGVIASDLCRAAETAAIVARHLGLPLCLEPGLREWDLGILAGLGRGEAERREPDAYAILREQIADRAVPGGESIRARSARVIAAIEGLARAHPGGRLCVVTHGGPIADCYRHAHTLPPGGRIGVGVHNAGISRMRVQGRRWQLLDWDRTDHLDGVGALGSWVQSDGP